MLALLLVSGVAGAQTVSTDTPTIAALRVRANAGDADAQWHLGVMYARGEGVPQHYGQSVAWHRKAADQGHASAQASLGYAYSHGQGVPQDFVEAHKWRNLAASRASAGDQTPYAEARDAVAQLMTPAQLAEAQQRASAWLAAFEKRGGK